MGHIYRCSVLRDVFYAQIWSWTAHKLRASFGSCLLVLFCSQIWCRRKRDASIGAKIILNCQREAELRKEYVLSVPFWPPPASHIWTSTRKEGSKVDWLIVAILALEGKSGDNERPFQLQADVLSGPAEAKLES